MTILKIDEAAGLLRVTKRTLYRLHDVPRVRIGHRWMFLKEDLEEWVRSKREGINGWQGLSSAAGSIPGRCSM
jgi:excisionase family DNA binding protein